MKHILTQKEEITIKSETGKISPQKAISPVQAGKALYTSVGQFSRSKSCFYVAKRY